jgi:broad specificity phosphatase PhoE
MGKIGIIRHGQTDLNLKGVIAGAQDIPINENGLRQAEELAGKLEGEKVNRIFSSGLRRAFRTAEIIDSRFGLGVTRVAGFNELSQGEWEGLALKEIKEKYPGKWEEWKKNPVESSPPGGESIPQVYDRVVKSLEELLPELKDGITLIVAHQVVNICIRCYLEGIELARVWDLESGNASIKWLSI